MEHANWAVTILLVCICGSVLWRIQAAKAGQDIYIRRIPGLEAFDEALGRAVEMGRPILFSPGFGELKDMSTYAGLAVLEQAVRRAAQSNQRLIVPVPYAPVYPLVQDRVREAYAAEGRPDLYKPEDVLFLSQDQNAFGAAVSGLMVRENVGAAFYFGYYGYESLLMAETGQRIGAMQVAATDAVLQVPFFLASCDYTMFGEELYAASAYLSREPVSLGSLSGQDLSKMLIALILLIGVCAALFSQFANTPAGGFNAVTGILVR